MAAEHIYNFLKKRRLKWAGVDPVAFSMMTVLWLAVHIALSFLAVHLVGRMESQDPWSIAAVVLVVVGWIGVYATYIWWARRIPGRDPVVVHPEEQRWMDRHGTLVSIIVSATIGLTGLALMIYFNLR